MTWLPTIVAVVGALASAFSPQLQGLVSQHPAIAGVIGSLYAIFTHVLNSPIGPPSPPDPAAKS